MTRPRRQVRTDREECSCDGGKFKAISWRGSAYCVREKILLLANLREEELVDEGSEESSKSHGWERARALAAAGGAEPAS